MSKILTFITILILSTFTMFAEERSEQQMREAAQRAITQNLPGRSRARSAGNDLKELMAMPKLKIFGYDDGGFAVVTSDDRFDEVIGYSSTTFAKEMPCGFKWWLNTVNEVMEKAKGSSPVSAKSRSKIKKAGIAPMITTKWGQTSPYNEQCKFTATDGKTYQMVTGCVATAMAQVMNYHKFPIRGNGTSSYTIRYNDDAFRIVFEEDFSKSVYDWNNMLDDYTTYKWSNLQDEHTAAVSKLMRDCGIAVKMRYSDSTYGSSSNLSSAANALKNHFYYDEKTKYMSRSSYSTDEWMGLIYNELNESRPILYAGSESDTNNSSGHAFVLHGYDTDGKVYINWGGDGSHSNDGYFNIDMLNPSGYNTTFNMRQSMVVVVPSISQPSVEKCDITINSSGNGAVTYNGSEIRNTSKTYTIIKNATVKLVFTPDPGNQIKSVVVGGIDVTSSLVANSYTITNLSYDTSVSATFEASSGSDINSSLSGGITGYLKTVAGSDVRVSMGIYLQNNSSYTINITRLVAKHPIDGRVLATITDSQQLGELKGGEQKKVNVNFNEDITPTFEWYYTYAGGSYLFSVKGTDVKHRLVIKSTGNGDTRYNGENIRNTSKTYDIKESFYSYTLYFYPDNGYQVKSLVIDGWDRTSKISSNNTYSENSASRDTEISVTYAEIIPEYTLSITSSGKGIVWYGNHSISEASKSFKIEKGKSAELTFSANYGYYIKSLVVNNEDVTSKIANNSFTISQISSDVNVKIEFAEQIPDGDNDGINAYLKCFVTMQMVNRMNSVFLSKSTFLTLANTHRNAINITKLVAKHPTKGHVLTTIEDKSQLGELKGGAEKNVTISYEEDVNPVYEWYYTYQGKSYMKKSEGKDVMTYELTIKATGNGSVGFNNSTLRDGTKRMNIDRGKSITLSIEPDKEYLIKSLLVNGVDETSKVSNNQYVISEIQENTSVEIVFEKDASAETQQFELRKRDLDVWIKSIETIVSAMPKTIDNYNKQHSALQAHLNVLSAAIGDKLTQSEKSVSSASISESDKLKMMTRLSEIKSMFDKCQTDANNLYEQIKKNHKSDQDIAADCQDKLNTAKVKLIMASDNDGLDGVELLLKQLEQSVKKGKNDIDNHFSKNSKAFKDVEEALTKTSQSIDEFNKQLEELINSMRSVIAVDCSREYGEENPELTYKTIGQINGVPQLSVLAFKFSPVGEYTIFVLSGTITTKGVNYVNGTMTITKAPLKITPKDIVVKFGDPMPEFELTYEGFKNTDTERVLSTKPVIETEAWSTRVPGRYKIVAYGAEAENYDISYGTGWLTIEEPSGVAPIKNDNDKSFNVYDLSGRLVRHQVTSLEGLREGVYVIDGKKIRINEVRNEK